MVDLDAKTQKVIISMATKDKVERQNIATTLQQIQTGQLLSGVNAKQIIVDSQLTEKQKERLLTQLGINQAVAQNSTINVANAIQQISAAKGISQAKKDELIATLANIAATNAQTGANLGLAASFKTLMASMGWIGWISIALSFLPMLTSAIDSIPTKAEKATEAFKETNEELSEAISDYKSASDELKTIDSRLEEIAKEVEAINLKGGLTLTDQATLTMLQQETAELERQRAISEAIKLASYGTMIEKGLEGIEDYNDAYEEMDDYYYSATSDSITKEKFEEAVKNAVTFQWVKDAWKNGSIDIAENLQERLDEEWDKKHAELKKEKIKLVEQLSEAISTIKPGYEYGTDKNIDEALDEFEEFVYDHHDNNMGTESLYKYLSSMSKYQKVLNEIKTAGAATIESLRSNYGENDIFKDFVDELIDIDMYTNVDDALSGIVNELNKVEGAAKGAETSFKSIAKTLSDGLDKLSNKKDILSEVKEELDSFGAISADNISKILEQFSDNDGVQQAVAYYLSGIGTAQQVYDAMAKGYKNDLKLQAQSLAIKMQNDEKYYESIGATNSSFVNWMKTNCYGVDLSNATSLADAKLKIENQLIGTLKTNWQKYYNAQSASLEELVARARALMLNTSRGRETYAGEHAEATKKYNEIKQLYDRYKKASDALDDLTLKGFSSSGFNSSLSTKFDDSSGKTEAEKFFDQLDYWLETNKITELKYYQDLAYYANQYYKQGKISLDEYASHTQKVYDWLKEQRKKDYEDDIEKLEKKKDAVSEYYDNLREQIENAHDEEDYEKEQSEKRKEIFDLDMQIAELMRDGSEKAKARIAELEEERLKAEEELLDFETDKAREDELSRLEKEQKTEEKKIQDKIDGIQKKLDKLDEDTISVRNAIIAYAKEKGVTLSFAYASGTRSSVGGFGRINEKGIEMISAPDGNGNYVNLMPNSYVFSAKATEFLWKLATEHSLPQAMYNSIAKSIKTQSSTPSVNIAQPINITMGDVIIKGNADKQTVFEIKKQRESDLRWILGKLKELQK